MNLHKWQTNSKELHKQWKKAGVDTRDTDADFSEKMSHYKVLGNSWDSIKDSLYFDIQHMLIFLSRRTNTKRYLLQAIGRIFHLHGPFFDQHVLVTRNLGNGITVERRIAR